MTTSVFGFFGLRENPFSINPNPRFLYLTPLAQASALQLVEGIRDRKGLMVLTGEVGTGKTLLLRRVLDWLAEQKMPTAMIFNSHVNPDNLLDFILSDFAIRCDSSLKSDKLIALNNWLLERFRNAQTPVLVIDEAQGLPVQALEEVRLLLNLETPRQKLLQVILAGQPELEEKLRRHDLRQLRQRITVRCRTAPLTAQETQAYIQSRLRTAGAREPIFQPQAAAAVHAYAHGIPRVINLLCEHSLINACADSSRVVSTECVERAAHDCQLDQIESVSRVLHSNYSGGSASDSISSIFSGMTFPDSASSGGHANGSGDSAVLAKSARPFFETESAPTNNSSVASATTALADPLCAPSDPFASVALVAPEEYPAAATSPAAEAPRAYGGSSSGNGSHGWHSESSSRSAAPLPRVGASLAAVSVFRAWWKSFSADARSTGRHLGVLFRAFASGLKPYARALADSLNSLQHRTLHLVSNPGVRARRDHVLAAIHRITGKIAALVQVCLTRISAGRNPRPQSPPSAHRASPGRASLDRLQMAKLRRWLRQPFTSQKRAATPSTRQRHHVGR